MGSGTNLLITNLTFVYYIVNLFTYCLLIKFLPHLLFVFAKIMIFLCLVLNLERRTYNMIP
jgi:hypothetical protein